MQTHQNGTGGWQSVEHVQLRDKAAGGTHPHDRSAVLGDKFEVSTEELGRGAYGQVFKGTDLRCGEPVAVKRVSLEGMSHESLQDMMQEIDLLKNLNHKNIVKYIGSYKTRSHLYIILEFMEQGALSQLIKRDRYGVLNEELIAAYISQVLAGLKYLHEQGVVHRDIKGANILMGAQGQVKLADFGVAARRDDSAQAFENDPVGTPYWMAPEVIEMTGAPTAASDIWSVGCLIIELFTGYPPYFDLQPMSALYRIVQDVRPPLPLGMSERLKSFLGKCFQKDPQDRPSASEILDERWLHTATVSLRSSWNKATGLVTRGTKPRDAHETVSSVVQRILAVEQANKKLPVIRASVDTVDEPLIPGSPPCDELGSATLALPNTKPHRVSDVLLNPSPLENSALQKKVDPTDAPENSISIGRVASVQLPSAPFVQTDRAPRNRPFKSRPMSVVNPATIRIEVPDGPKDPGRDRSSSKSSISTPGRSPLGSLSQSPEGRAVGSLSTRPTPSATPMLAGLLDGLPTPDLNEHPAYLETVLNDLMRRGSMTPMPDDRADVGDSQGASPANQTCVTASLALGVQSAGPRPVDDDLERRRQKIGQVRNQVAVLHNIQQRYSVVEMLTTCKALTTMCLSSPEHKAFFLGEAGIIAVMELLQYTDESLLTAALHLLLAVISDDTAVLESLCLVGIVPIVNRLAAPDLMRGIRNTAASFVEQLCKTSAHTVQMFVACGGIPVLVGMLESNYTLDSTLVSAAMESTWCILQAHGPTPVNHYCRLLVKAGLVPQLLAAMCSMCECASKLPPGAAQAHAAMPSPAINPTSSITDRKTDGRSTTAAQASYAETLLGNLDHVCNLILVLSHSDSVVKSHMCQSANLQRLFDIIQDLPESLLQKMLSAVQNLTGDPQVLKQMQDSQAVPMLVDVLKSTDTRSGVRLVPSLQLPLLQSLHNLCKMSKERQAEAGSAGVTPILSQLAQRVIHSNTSKKTSHTRTTSSGPPTPRDIAALDTMRVLCIGLLCALAHSNSRTRTELWGCQGLDLFIDLLRESEWRRQALDALAIWLLEDTQRVEPKLLLTNNINTVVVMFSEATGPQERLLAAFDRILNSSQKLCVAFGSQSSLPAIMVRKLTDADAFLATCVLEVIQSLYESHPRPKEFILRYDLATKLQNVMQKHESAIKVVDKCQTLLRAVHVNTIL